MGHFLPPLLAMIPNNGYAINEPIDFIDAVHDASSIEIFPVFRGDWFDVRRKIAGDDQPMPKPTTQPKSITSGEKIRKQKLLISLWN